MPAASGASGPTTVSATSLLARERDEVGNRRERDVGQLRLARGAGVAGRDEHLGHARRLRELPRERMLAAAAADDENVHAGEPQSIAILPKTYRMLPLLMPPFSVGMYVVTP